mgnify:FL=1
MEDVIQNKNICFSCANEVSDKERQKKYKEQRMTRGFDDTECWNLDITFSLFIIPRLKVFKELNDGYPARYNAKEEWDKILDEMIEGFELHSNKFNWDTADSNEENGNMAKAKKAIRLFQENFFDLWW